MQEVSNLHERDAVMTSIRYQMTQGVPEDGTPWQRLQWGWPVNAVVTKAGKRWRSLVDFNVWEPGVSAWREEPVGDTPAPYRQPTGAHDAYKKGDRVLFNGEIYISNQDGNVWSPAELPSGWVKEV